MFSISLLWCFVFISFRWSFLAAEEKAIAEAEINVGKDFEIIAKAIADDGSQAYVACDSDSLGKQFSCKAVRGNIFDVKSFNETGKCSFERPRRIKKNAAHSSNMKIEFMSNTDKAVVSWSEVTVSKVYQHVVIVNFLKFECKHLDFAQTASNTFLNNTIVYKDKSAFDVVTSDENACKRSGLRLWGNDPKTCRKRFNEGGDPTGDIEDFYSGMRHFRVMPVLPDRAARGFFAYGWKKIVDSHLTLEHISKSGEVKSSIVSKIAGSKDDLLISTSNAHGKTTLCAYDSRSKTDRKLQCHVYSSQDLDKMNSEPSYEYSYKKKIETFSVMNLVSGKILVATVENDGERRLVMTAHEQDEPSEELFNEEINSVGEDIELKIIEHKNEVCSYVLCKKNMNQLKGFKGCAPN